MLVALVQCVLAGLPLLAPHQVLPILPDADACCHVLHHLGLLAALVCLAAGCHLHSLRPLRWLGTNCGRSVGQVLSVAAVAVMLAVVLLPGVEVLIVAVMVAVN